MNESTASSRTARLRFQIAELERKLADAQRHEAPATGAARARGLREREALLVEAERVAQVGTWVWDLVTNEVTWSDQLFRILGYDPRTDHPSRDALYRAVHVDDRERVRSATEYGTTTGRARAVEFRVVRPSGEVREVVMDGAGVRDGEGDLARFVGTVLDLTQRRWAERELQRRESLLREAQLIASVGSWVWDFGTNQVEWSEELFRICGVDPAQDTTLELYMSLVHPEDRERAVSLSRRAVETGIAEPAEYRIVRPDDGSVRHVYTAARQIRDADGDVTGLLGTVLDVTDRKRLEVQLHQAQKMEAVGRLAGGVAHDFNNLLTAIRFYVDLLEERVPGEELSHIAEAVEAAASLTRQLLAFSRQAVVKPERVDLNAITRDAVRLIRRVIGEQVEIDLRLGPDLWSVRADAGQLQQVLLNLAVNSRDAMPDGGTLEIATANVRVDQAYRRSHPGATFGDSVRLRVRDTGVGMDEATRSRVFEPFFTTKETGKGTGLGMATVFGIVTQSEGSIELRSEPGQGAVVEIHLPRARGPAARRERRVGRELVPGGAETILLVEDDAEISDVVTRVLSDAGYRVLPARRPSQALQLGGRHREEIRLILSDIGLPEMSGRELVRRLKANGCAGKVLFITGYAAPSEPGSEPELEAPHLAKPFRAAELLRAVRELLDADTTSAPRDVH